MKSYSGENYEVGGLISVVQQCLRSLLQATSSVYGTTIRTFMVCGPLVHSPMTGTLSLDEDQDMLVGQRGILLTLQHSHTYSQPSKLKSYRLQNATFALKSPGYSYLSFFLVARIEFTFSSIMGRARYKSSLNPCTPSSSISAHLEM